LSATLAEEDDHDHDHDHEDEADCSCISGLFFDDLVTDIACDDSDSITAMQQYLVDNDCSDYCHVHDDEKEYHHEDAASFMCYQTWAVVVQYHNQCPSGSVDEDVYHDFLDACPDCHEAYYVHPNAPNCTIEESVCENADEQVGAVTYVRDNCVDACDGNCTVMWQMVESIHLLCDHDDLSVEFEEIFESGIEDTVCGDAIYCNVIEDEGDANCSSHANEEFDEYRVEYGALDVNAVLEAGSSGAAQLVFGMAAALSVVAALFA